MGQYTTYADIKVASVLTGLDEDRKIAAQSNKTNRVKIEKGHAWLVRFLPFTFGQRGLPWARIAQHWINGKPCYCKQHTSPDFGGDPNYICPICEVAEAMHSQADNDDDRDDFYQVQHRLSFLMYCLVIAKEDDRGRQEVMSDEEILSPYEFNIPKTAFATFSAKLERSKARKGGDPNIGLLSLESGCDLWVARDKKNTYNFDLSDNGYGPVFDMDDHYEGKIVRVWRQLKQPSVKFLADDRINAIADMIAERAFKEAADSLNPENSRRSRRSRDDDGDGDSPRGAGRSFGRTRADDAGDDDQPARQAPARTAARTAAPPARQAATPSRVAPRVAQAAEAALEETQEAPPADDDQIPGAEVPAQEQAEQEQGDPQAEVPAQEQTEPEPPPVRSRVSARPSQAPAEDSAVDEAEVPAVRRPAAGATPRPATPPPAVAAARRVSAPAAVSAGRPAAVSAGRPAPVRAAAESGQVDDDPEVLPEERRDPAPPTRETAAPAAAPARSAVTGSLGSRIAAMRRNQG